MKIAALLGLCVALFAGCAGLGAARLTEDQMTSLSARLQPGMSVDEVRQALGQPSETARYPNLGESVLSWLYTEHGNRQMFFNAHFDASNSRLKYTSRTPDPSWIRATEGPAVTP